MSASPSRPAPIDPQVIAAAQSPAAPASKPSSKAAKPVSKSKPVSSKTKPASSVKKPVSASKKPASSATKKAAAPKKVSPSKVSGDTKLSFEDMIKDAIKNDKENVRGGVSRPAIKKYLAFRFKILDTPSNVSRLNKAISRGAEKGIFALPKGASGKVKLGKTAPEAKVTKPASKPTAASKTAAKKPASTKSPKKVPKKTFGIAVKKSIKKVPTASTKRIATAKKSVGKKTSSTTKKATSVKKS